MRACACPSRFRPRTCCCSLCSRSSGGSGARSRGRRRAIVKLRVVLTAPSRRCGSRPCTRRRSPQEHSPSACRSPRSASRPSAPRSPSASERRDGSRTAHGAGGRRARCSSRPRRPRRSSPPPCACVLVPRRAPVLRGTCSIVAALQSGPYPPRHSRDARTCCSSHHYGFDLLTACKALRVTRVQVDLAIDVATLGLLGASRGRSSGRSARVLVGRRAAWVTPALALFAGGVPLACDRPGPSPWYGVLVGCGVGERALNAPVTSYFFQHPFALGLTLVRGRRRCSSTERRPPSRAARLLRARARALALLSLAEIASSPRRSPSPSSSPRSRSRVRASHAARRRSEARRRDRRRRRDLPRGGALRGRLLRARRLDDAAPRRAARRLRRRPRGDARVEREDVRRAAPARGRRRRDRAARPRPLRSPRGGLARGGERCAVRRNGRHRQVRDDRVGRARGARQRGARAALRAGDAGPRRGGRRDPRGGDGRERRRVPLRKFALDLRGDSPRYAARRRRSRATRSTR